MGDIVPIAGHRDYYRQTKRGAAGVLSACKKKRATEILVIGADKDGNCFVQGSPPDPANACWLMEMARKILTKGEA